MRLVLSLVALAVLAAGCELQPFPIPVDAGGCAGDSECDDGNPCTSDVCVAGTCEISPVAAGTSCSSGGDLCDAHLCTVPFGAQSRSLLDDPVARRLPAIRHWPRR